MQRAMCTTQIVAVDHAANLFAGILHNQPVVEEHVCVAWAALQTTDDQRCRHSRQMSCWGRICIRALPYWHTSWICPGSITGPRLLWILTSHLCGAGPIAGCSSPILSAIYPRVGCAPQHRAWCVLVHFSWCVCYNAKQGSHQCQSLEHCHCK